MVVKFKMRARKTYKLIKTNPKFGKKMILGMGKLGTILLLFSIILIAVGYFSTEKIESFFATKILLEENSKVNFFIRLYAGFLFSSAMTLTAQMILWLLRKAVVVGMEQNNWADDIKTVRSFSVYALIILAGTLYLIAGKSIVVV
jgi:hypothetical protein